MMESNSEHSHWEATEDDIQRCLNRQIEEESHLKLAYLSRASLLRFARYTANPPLPPDASIRNCGYDLHRDAVVLYIRSKDYESVPDGGQIPPIEGITVSIDELGWIESRLCHFTADELLTLKESISERLYDLDRERHRREQAMPEQ